MGLEDVIAAASSFKKIGLAGGDVGYYLALAGFTILAVAALFFGTVIVVRGLKSIADMEPGEFLKFLLVSAFILIGLGALLP